MSITKQDVTLLASVNNHRSAANVSLVKLLAKAVRSIYSNAGKTETLDDGKVVFCAAELAQYVLDNVDFTYRQHCASWLRKQGCVVDLLDAKEVKARGCYAVQNFPLSSKRQGPVFAAIKLYEDVVSGKIERPDDFEGDVLPQNARPYVEKAAKVLSTEAAEIQKRADAAMDAFIARLGKTDPAAKAKVNEVWARKTEESMAFIDGAGHCFKLTDDESNAIVSLIQHMRKETMERPERETMAE